MMGKGQVKWSDTSVKRRADDRERCSPGFREPMQAVCSVERRQDFEVATLVASVSGAWAICVASGKEIGRNVQG